MFLVFAGETTGFSCLKPRLSFYLRRCDGCNVYCHKI